MKFVSNAPTATIRTTPENYLVAYKTDPCGYWICDPDLAIPEEVAVECFKVIRDIDLRWGKGEAIAEILNKQFNR